MEVKKIDKERLGEKVLFPRTQLAGLTCEDKDMMPQRQDFDVELIHDVPKMGTVKLIVQQQSPHMVFQLFETKSEEQFDDFLGKLLGMHVVAGTDSVLGYTQMPPRLLHTFNDLDVAHKY